MFSKTWIKDTVERVAATFAESALGLWILTGPADTFSLSALKLIGTSAVIAAAAVLKSAIAAKIGNKDSASLDPSLVTVEVPAAPKVA